jgi:anti-anti-sigma factor
MALTTSQPSADDSRSLQPPLLTCEVRVQKGDLVVALRGEADASTRPVLCDALARVIARGAGHVVIDLTELRFIDAGTGRILATAHELLERQGRNFALRSPSMVAQRVLQLFGMADLIEAQLGDRRQRG